MLVIFQSAIFYSSPAHKLLKKIKTAKGTMIHSCSSSRVSVMELCRIMSGALACSKNLHAILDKHKIAHVQYSVNNNYEICIQFLSLYATPNIKDMWVCIHFLLYYN